MTVLECVEAISLTDGLYDNKEDKNYYLVHKTMELIPLMKDEDIEELKDKLFERYSYQMYSSFREYVCIMDKNDVMHGENHIKEPQYEKVESTNIIDFYNSYDDNLIYYVKGHLFLEFAMNTIISKVLKVRTEKKTFANKIDLLFNKSLISDKVKDLLKAINKQRNEIAHNLHYILTFDVLYELVKLSADAGVDYSDNTIYINKKLSNEWYGMQGIIQELFTNTFCHLFYENEKYFEENEISQYIS